MSVQAVMTLVYCHVMRRGDVIQVRVSAGEKARIERLAGAAGVSASEWVRARALGQALAGAEEGALDRKVSDPAPVGSAESRGSAAPARASGPFPVEPVNVVVTDAGEVVAADPSRPVRYEQKRSVQLPAGVRPAREFVKPFRPLPKKS